MKQQKTCFRMEGTKRTNAKQNKSDQEKERERWGKKNELSRSVLLQHEAENWHINQKWNLKHYIHLLWSCYQTKQSKLGDSSNFHQFSEMTRCARIWFHFHGACIKLTANPKSGWQTRLTITCAGDAVFLVASALCLFGTVILCRWSLYLKQNQLNF